MNLSFDLKYAWRLLKQSWGYSLTCASVVALSVGLAVWTYELAYSQLLKPLDFPESERWYSVQIGARAGAIAQPVVDAYTYQEMLAQNRAADYLGAFTRGEALLSEGQASTTLRASSITPRLLASTRVPPLLGRMFQDADGRPGAAAVAIISYDAWQNYFAADPRVIGRTARIDAAPVQIVGVMPKESFIFRDFEIWTPLQIPHIARPADSTTTVSPLILLGKNQNLGSVLNEMKSAVDRVNSDYPDQFTNTRWVKLVPAHMMYTHNSTPVVLTLSFMAAAVVLLGCVNISTVFLARLLERSRELALRNALGASRSRLLRQCLMETLPIVLVGLVVGYILAAMGVRWAQGIGNSFAQMLAAGRLPNLLALRPIGLVTAVISATAIWLLSTLIPAWSIAKRDAAVVLAGSGKGTAHGSSKSVGLLVGLEVIISSLVLMICGVVVLAINKEVGKPTGLNTTRVMTSTFPTVFGPRYAEPSQRLRYWDNLPAAIESRMPGAEVAFTSAVPTTPASVAVSVETQQGTDKQGKLRLPLMVVSDNYFKMMGLTLRTGRLFDSTDANGSLNVAVIDEKIAARFWPDTDALGKRIQLNPSDNGSWLTVVGIVSGVAAEPYRRDLGVVYRPLRQVVPNEFQIVVRLPNTAADSRVSLRAAAFGVDRDLPLHNLQMLDDYLGANNLRWTSLVSIIIVIAIGTAILAASGLFGLISRSVVQRTQEVGVRRALGATAWRATSMFVRQGALYLSVAIVGAAAGLAITPLLSRTIPNILDRVVLVVPAVIILLAGVIFLSSYFPTRRAVALEPGDALRYE